MSEQHKNKSDSNAVSRLLDFDGVRHPDMTPKEILRPELIGFLSENKTAQADKTEFMQDMPVIMNPPTSSLRQFFLMLLAAVLLPVFLNVLDKNCPRIMDRAKTFWKNKFKEFSRQNQRSIYSGAIHIIPDPDKSNHTNSVIKGIIFNADHPSVLIGSGIYQKGDRLGDAEIVEIKEDCIMLEKIGKKWSRKVGDKPL